jgi:glycosyltransferase involved in cell wall biosynthesis
MRPRVLIVSPVHNEADHIERVLRSVAAQTRRPDRWIVVDDGSSDETPRLLAEWVQRLEFLTVVAGPPQDPEGRDRLGEALEAKALNHGLS